MLPIFMLEKYYSDLYKFALTDVNYYKAAVDVYLSVWPRIFWNIAAM